MTRQRRIRAALGIVALGIVALSLVPARALGQVIEAPFDTSYTYTDLGSAPGVPPLYGGLCLLAGSPNHLLLGGGANNVGGKIYDVEVTRDGSGHINGFTGSTSVLCDADYNDGGVCYGPGGLLYASRWPVNQLGMYKPGSVTPDRIIDMGALGAAGSHSALNFIPGSHPGAGRMKVCSWGGGEFYDADYGIDGGGLLYINSITQTATLSGGPEGFAYVTLGSPEFANPSMIVSEYSAGNVSVYEMDSNGDPIVGSRRLFMSGLSGAEGAFVDPFTGDFLFSTFGGGDRVIVVKGFAAPEPGTMALLIGGIGMLASRRRRAKK